jgi:hypothetical protein
VLGDGRVLLAEPNSSSFVLCNSSAAECSPLALRRGGKAVRPVEVTLLQGVGVDRFVASDSDGRRLLLVNDRGEILAERELGETAADAYHVPYQPRLSADGELLVSNRKDRKILRLNSTTLEPMADAFGVRGASCRWMLPARQMGQMDGGGCSTLPLASATARSSSSMRRLIRCGASRYTGSMILDPWRSSASAY